MTGKPFWKKRVILSEKVNESLTEKKDFNKAAINFKQALASSLSSPTLNVGLAAKAAMDASGSKKPNYENSDGKTRTNKGGTPGMVELPGGYRMIPGAKGGKGKVLNLFPSKLSKESLLKTPNFGWIDKTPDTPLDEFIKKSKNELQVRIRKYKVNSRTNEIIENTEKLVDPFSVSGDEPEQSEIKEKVLPGRTIGASGGGNLMTRAAGALGIVIDELGKMRCPPGTPSANQFTDNTGSNCFGVSAGDFVNFALDAAAQFERDGKMNFWRQLVQENVAAYHGYKKYEEIPGLGRTLWRDSRGNLINNDWRDAKADSTNSRLFINGMINGQDRLKMQDMAISDLMDMFPSVRRTPDARARNNDLLDLFDDMRSAGIHDVKFTGRLDNADVDKLIVARLERINGWSSLDKSRQDLLIKVDTERYYETERALLEAYVDEIIKNPAHMRTVTNINWETKPYDHPQFDYASSQSQGFGVGGVINIDIHAIMKAQEIALPGLRPDERMRIDVTGFATDAEKGKTLANFLMTASSTANEAAAMVEYRGFARNIMKHELAHTIQFVAIENEIERQITTNGFISVADINTGKLKKVTDASDLTGDDIHSLMMGINDSINIADLNGALSRIDVVNFLGGDYALSFEKSGNELWAMETCAELWALRDAGIIHGADIDAALDWMDATAYGKYTTARPRINLAAAGAANNGNYRPIPSPISTPVNIPTSPTPGMMTPTQVRDSLKAYKDEVKNLSEPEFAIELADNLNVIDVINARIEMDSANGLDVSGHELELDAHIEANKILHREYHKQFGVSPAASKKKLEKEAKAIREAQGTLTQDEMMIRQREKDIVAIENYAGTLSTDELIDSIVGYESRIKASGVTPKKKQELTEEAQIYRDAYKKALEDAGDTRTWAQQRRELEKKIHERLFPAPSSKKTPIKKFKGNNGKDGAMEFANQQREELMKIANFAQSEAIVELADTNATSVGQLLNPETSVAAARAMSKRNARLLNLGIQPNPRSRDQASVEDQVKNILIPAMELIDESSVKGNFEIDAVVELSIDPTSGAIDITKDVEHQGMLTGRMFTTKNPAVSGAVLDGSGKPVIINGKQKQRVVIQVNEGDRGIFPHWSFDKMKDDGTQRFTLPPGKLRIIEQRPDGTIVAQVVEQKNTQEVLDSLVVNLGETGPLPTQHSDMTKKKISRVVDRYMVERNDKGMPMRPPKSRAIDNVEEANVQTTRAVASSGGSFGEPPSSDYVADMSIFSSGVSKSSARKKFDGSTPTDVFGPPQTRQERAKVRNVRQNATFDIFKSALSSGPSSSMPGITRESMDPRVADLVSTSSNEELARRVEEAAVEMHKGFDKRPRVRMRQSELDNFVKSGKVTNTPSSRLSSGPSAQRIQESIGKSEINYQDAVKRVSNLEEAIKIFDETGEWKGGDFGLIASRAPSPRDGGIDSPNASATNLTASQVIERAGSKEEFKKILDEKLDTAKKEVVMQKFLADRKKMRHEQNVLDIEDISPEEIEVLKAETKRLKELEGRDIGAYEGVFAGEDGKSMVTHVGSDVLEDGKLNPGKTIGDNSTFAPGNTQFLNNSQIVKIKNNIDDRKKENESIVKIVEKIRAGEKVTIESGVELNALKKSGLVDSRSQIGDSLDAASSRFSGPEAVASYLESFAKQNDSYVETYEKLIKRINESSGSGYLSAYPASYPMTTRGYFGRYAEQDLPADIGVSQTEFDRSMRGNQSQIVDPWMHSRWLSNLRGTAWIAEGREGEDITSLLGPTTERQLLGINTPVFGISARRDAAAELDEVGNALVARAAQLRREGKQVTPESVLSTRLSSAPSAQSGRRIERRVAPSAERVLTPQMDTIRTSETGRAARPTQVATSKFSSGSMRRHADRPADMERMFPNAEEEAKRVAHEEVAKSWRDSGYGWIEVPRYQADANLSNDFLRGRELGVNQAEFQWSGDQAIGMKPKDFNPKARGSDKYFQWYDNWLKSMRTYLDAHGKDSNGNPRMDDEWRGIEAAIWEKKIQLMPDTTSWQKEQIRTLERALEDRKFDMARRPSPIGTKSLKLTRGERTIINGGPAIDRLVSEYHTKIGLDPSLQEEERPVTGYLVHKSHIGEKKNRVKQSGQGNFASDAVYEIGDEDVVGDGLTALGDIEVILRKETSGRTAYGRGESIDNGHRPVLLNSTDSQDISDALTNVEGISGKNKNSYAMLHLLGAGLDNNFAHVNAGLDENGKMASVGKTDSGKRSRDIFEAHILGGFSKDDVEGIHYPYSRLKIEAANEDISNIITTEMINAELKKFGASPIEIQDFNNQMISSPVNTDSMQRLREVLYAKKIKKRYQDQGIGYVRFAHPTGINIENPRSYDKSASGSEDVIRVLTKKIVQEIGEMIPNMLKAMRKNKTPQLIGGE